MKKIILSLSVLALLIMVGCIFNVENTKQQNNYYLYSGKQKILDQGTQNNSILNLYIMNYDKLSPLNPKSNIDIAIYSLLFTNIFEIDDELSISSSIIEKYSYDHTKKSLTLSIKDDLKWSNGRKMISQDLINTINSVLSIENGYYNSCKMNIDTIVRINENEIKILLKKNDPNFIYKMNIPMIAFDSISDTFLFSGPYKISLEDDEKIELEGNSFWNKTLNSQQKTQNIEKIIVYKYMSTGDVFTDFNSKKLDFIYIPSTLSENFVNRNDLQVYNFMSNEYEMLVLNTEEDFYQDNNIKHIVNNTLNPKKILNKISLDSIDIKRLPVDNTMIIKEKNYVEIDEALLKQIKKSTYNYKSKKIDILFNSENRDRRLLATEIKKILELKGLIVNLDISNYTTYISKFEKGDYDIALIGTKIDFDPVSDFLYNPFPRYFYDINSTKHFIDNAYKNLELNGLGDEILNNPKDLMYINKIVDIIDKDIPYIGLYFKRDGIAFSNRLHGIENPTRTNYFNGIESWYLESN